MLLRLDSACDLNIVFCVTLPQRRLFLTKRNRLKCNGDLMYEITLSLGPADELCVDTVQH